MLTLNSFLLVLIETVVTSQVLMAVIIVEATTAMVMPTLMRMLQATIVSMLRALAQVVAVVVHVPVVRRQGRVVHILQDDKKYNSLVKTHSLFRGWVFKFLTKL